MRTPSLPGGYTSSYAIGLVTIVAALAIGVPSAQAARASKPAALSPAIPFPCLRRGSSDSAPPCLKVRTTGSGRAILSEARGGADEDLPPTARIHRWPGGAALAWPCAAIAQGPGRPIVGYLYNGTTLSAANGVAEFREGLDQAGYVEGRNVEIEFRFSQGDRARLPELAADLVRRQVAVIVAAGGPAPALAAKAITSTIPIIFVMASDPVRYGIREPQSAPGQCYGCDFLGSAGGQAAQYSTRTSPPGDHSRPSIRFVKCSGFREHKERHACGGACA
jgi:hypothetical protein